jgi:Mrp family chromosome partitioning ATPase
VVRNALDTRIRSASDIPRVAGLQTVTSMPAARGRGRDLSGEARQESIRTLRANLLFGSQATGAIAVAAVTSAADALSVARELGRAFGEIGANVVVVDTNLTVAAADRSRTTRREQSGQPGLADVLTGRATLAEAITVSSSANVYSLGAGAVDATSPQLLSTPAMRVVLSRLKETYSFVVLSCPPLTERSESAVVAALADSALVIVGARGTSRAQFLFGLELLSGVRVDSFSVAVADVRDLALSASSERS